jgi:hypothetical protein
MGAMSTPSSGGGLSAGQELWMRGRRARQQA